MTQYTTVETAQEIPYGYCHCGCGGKTTICKKTRPSRGHVKGEPLRYIHGHNGSGHLVERFWSKAGVTDPSLCWMWRASKDHHGYGIFSYHGARTTAHRVAYELSSGPIPDGLSVCHTCDHPACVNPAHLFAATYAENMADMRAKGRGTHGEKHNFAKLSEKQVIDIRLKHSIGATTQKELAEEYAVHQTTIFAVVHRINWKHLP